jgi:hypothetical protein
MLCHAVPPPPSLQTPGKSPISIDEVEDAAEIMKRFCTGGMSLGAISREVRTNSLRSGIGCLYVALAFSMCIAFSICIAENLNMLSRC